MPGARMKTLLIALAAGLAAFVATLLIGRAYLARDRLPEEPGPLHLTGPAPYERIADTESYRLEVGGLVGRELSLSLDEIKAMPAVQTDAPLDCVVGWTDHAVWRGVPVRDVIAPARPDPEGGFVVFRDDRDYSATLSMDYVLGGEPILAWEVNGRPLPREHGWPLRVVAPGKYGYKWVKWVTEIEVSDRGYEGTYEESGFSLDGDADGPRTEWEREHR
jgi:DMSO/TMAO reductase YedYZ molybdopterin-dependent catalytic subunit